MADPVDGRQLTGFLSGGGRRAGVAFAPLGTGKFVDIIRYVHGIID